MFHGSTKNSVVLFVCACLCRAMGQTPAVTSANANLGYTIGPGDELSITVADADEVKDVFANPFATDNDGYIAVPMVGRIHVADLTTGQLQTQIRDGLRKYIRDPQVFVNVKTTKSQTVSVLGAVNSPGVHQVAGPRTLMEVLALAGGLSKDAGYKIDVSRQRKWGVIPLPDATSDPSGQFSTAEVSTRRLTEDKNPADNILVKPNDVITVPRAEVVYVIGEVKKPGGFTLGDRKEVSVLEVLSLAEGMTGAASQSKAKILRSTPGSSTRVQVKIDLKKVFQGKSGDVELAASDILFVPDNSKKRAGVKMAETALATLSGIIIWRGF